MSDGPAPLDALRLQIEHRELEMGQMRAAKQAVEAERERLTEQLAASEERRKQR